MKVGTAMELLGLVGTALDEMKVVDVQPAFAAAVWQHHPDAQGQAVGAGTKADIDQLKQARNVLLRHLTTGGDFACKQCSGKGTVPARLGVRPCGACRGTGERNGG